jgi:hypothetical protein
MKKRSGKSEAELKSAGGIGRKRVVLAETLRRLPRRHGPLRRK